MSIYDEAKNAPNADRREALAKHAIKSESEKYRRAMISSASSEPGIPLRPGDLDRDPWLLNCPNGTVDLRTGQLYPHRRTDLITKLAPAVYDPGGKCPIWESFLNRIFNKNADLIHFIQKSVGYSLTADIREQSLFLLHGNGANGKTTFLETIRKMLGEYACTSDFNSFMITRDGVRNDIARLFGVRFSCAIEAPKDRQLNESLVKSLTGGDTICARFLFKEFFDFTPIFKLWLETNHKPKIQGTNYAIWRRIRLIPFDVTIPPEEQDKTLLARLREESPGILAWAMRGCLKWQAKGLNPPKEVITATSEYRIEQDPLSGFLADCCVIEPSGRETVGNLYTTYSKWCDEADEELLSKIEFGKQLTDRGFKMKPMKNVRYRLGICLKVKDEMHP